ncbi:uncharacterized protein LTR77_000113 [Saxophila tyrrhenica]|uniref:FAD-binding PCMH-type domain-containing protein n=1 Tax=Saxophila tyrrhenica TaxID=1690608 RepID=A0AAV9PMB8_9PEZI|nr:hypothetical protein LTR77_000113 [Saxophila tyrrhenica]
MRGIDLVKTLNSTSPTEPSALVNIHAGERFMDIHNFAVKNKLTILGGADPHVGIGGWTLGGGHDPLTAKYGMGADQVVEMDVVTADGALRTINEHCEPELFWVMRGSGGSTFAVLISVTVKAYPSISTGLYTFSYNTTSDSDTFWAMTAYFHSQLPRLSKAGLFSYYFVYPLMPGVKNESTQGMVAGEFLDPGLTATEMQKIVAPMEAELNAADWGDPVYKGGLADEHPDFSAFWAKNNAPQDAGISGKLGSRLLDKKALTSDMAKLKASLRTSTPVPWSILGHLVAGAGTHSPPDGIPGSSNAVGPGWRKAYAHVVLPRTWTPLNDTQKITASDDLRNARVEALRQLAPDTGAYVNEVDPTEPEWQDTLYGDQYSRLLEAKSKWDPTGVFWCQHCVSSELWDADDPYGLENRV